MEIYDVALRLGALGFVSYTVLCWVYPELFEADSEKDLLKIETAQIIFVSLCLWITGFTLFESVAYITSIVALRGVRRLRKRSGDN